MSAEAGSYVYDRRYVAARRIGTCGRAVEIVSVLLLLLALAATILIGSEADWDEHRAGTVGAVIGTGLQLVTPTLVLLLLGVWAQSYAMTRLGEIDQR